MGRAVTKNAAGELEVDETFTFSGSNPTLDSVKLIAEDGKAVDKENPSWLAFTQTTSGSDLTATLLLDASGLSTYTTYTFLIEASDDAGNQKSRRVNVGIGSLAINFTFANVMGQEDKYRQESGSRVQRGGTARVVARTSMDATLDLEYVKKPSDEDNPTFDQSASAVSTGKRNHEFFFPVDPAALYAFRLTAKADYDNSVSDLTSGIYYFLTGSTITVGVDQFIFATVSTSVTSVDKTLGVTASGFSDKTATKQGDGSGSLSSGSSAGTRTGPDKQIGQTVSISTTTTVN